MNIAHTIHTLELVALLVPFVVLSLGLIGGAFYIAWVQPKGRR